MISDRLFARTRSKPLNQRQKEVTWHFLDDMATLGSGAFDRILKCRLLRTHYGLTVRKHLNKSFAWLSCTSFNRRAHLLHAYERRMMQNPHPDLQR